MLTGKVPIAIIIVPLTLALLTIAIAVPAIAQVPPRVEVDIEEIILLTDVANTSGTVVNEVISAADDVSRRPPASQYLPARPTVSHQKENRKSRDAFSRGTGSVKERGEESDNGNLGEAGNAGSVWMVVLYVVIGLVSVALLGLLGRRLRRRMQD